MKVSHEGLGITDEEWERFIIHVTATLRNQAVAEREANEFLAAAESVRAEIVEKSQMAIT